MPAEVLCVARALAEEAYIYAYPMLLGYGFFHAQVSGPQTAESQGINRLTHFRRLGSPDFNNYVPWINTDTPYSAGWLDLHAEPMVLDVPAFEQYRFQNIQLNDWYTHNFANKGTRTPGNGAARYLIAGPDWQGGVPQGIDDVLRSETRFAKLVARILLENPDDYPNIHALQDQYRLQPLSAYLGEAVPPTEPAVEFPAPTAKGFFEIPSASFISYFNFLLQHCSIHTSESAMFERFARIGIAPGKAFDAGQIAPELRQAIDEGARDGHAQIMERLKRLCPCINGWQYPMDLRGGRDMMAVDRDSYLRRAVAARYAIWGPAKEEVVYMVAETDADGALLDGSKHDYVLDLPVAPPARGFWSFTVYDAKTRLLVGHPSGRYKLGDRDAGMLRGADGSLKLHLQHEFPGRERESNWLPVPKQPFQIVARLYWPREELLNGTYLPPGIEKLKPPRPSGRFNESSGLPLFEH